MGSAHESRIYRRNRMLTLQASDLCGICGHGGALTCDHIIPANLWPRDGDGRFLPGLHDLENLQPAHGILHNPTRFNPCPVCHRMCNQSKGDAISAPPSPRSRVW